jgi:hypothetical protein
MAYNVLNVENTIVANFQFNFQNRNKTYITKENAYSIIIERIYDIT